MKKVCVIGLGYIGLPTASLLATKGFIVHGVDVNKEIVRTINNGGLHIFEPDLDVMVKAAVQSGNLKAALEPSTADIYLIAVPTPFKDDHVPDLSYVEAAFNSIIPLLKSGDTIILDSTCPVGTTEKMAELIKNKRPDLIVSTVDDGSGSNVHHKHEQIYLAYCPERVLPGQILKELVNNDRIVGGIDKLSALKAKEFYESFITGEVIITNARTAELCKLVENAYRDVNIAFANELSLICDKLGIDVWELIECANRHPRVNILQPGPGVGGHCIAIDPWFIVHSFPEEARLIHTARIVNDYKPYYVLRRIKDEAKKFDYPVIACLGLSYKADIDDLRESPALEIVRNLSSEATYKLFISDPYIEVIPECLQDKTNIEMVDSRTAIDKANIVVLLVDHKVFKTIEQDLFKNKILIDTRGIFRH